MNFLASQPSFKDDIRELQQEEDDQDKESHQQMLVKESEGKGQDDDQSVRGHDDEGAGQVGVAEFEEAVVNMVHIGGEGGATLQDADGEDADHVGQGGSQDGQGEDGREGSFL